MRNIAAAIVLVTLCAVASAEVELRVLLREAAIESSTSSHVAQFTGMMPDELSSWMSEQSLSAKTASAAAAPTRDISPAMDASEAQESMEALRTAEFISDIVAALWSYHPPPAQQ
ncbi:hypothetical protein IWW38_003477 [Coemansia aciculifera]|uniref:Uncharacterized protein n=1 Tax=Coemansia aciculifera TaxID=417176 RepID=A0ACC1M0M5_9FUNG|nr:hypothetical protein IWW38_003477 [Coemansia aciculifera]